MSTQTMNDRLVDHAVEVQEIDKDDDLLKIVNNVETRLIQESIQEEWKNHDETKRQLKDFSILAASLPVFISSLFVLLGVGSDVVFIGLPALVIVVFGMTGIVAGTISAFLAAGDRKEGIKDEINTQRIELAEKMLNIEILKKVTVGITEEWDEVMALDKNGDYVKILMRIVKDTKTGLETIESKMLKNQ